MKVMSLGRGRAQNQVLITAHNVSLTDWQLMTSSSSFVQDSVYFGYSVSLNEYTVYQSGELLLLLYKKTRVLELKLDSSLC